MNCKYYILILNKDGVVVSKGIKYAELVENEVEVEITEDQYNQINEFPLKLIFDENGKIVSWEKVEIEYEPIDEQPREPTLEEEIEELKQLVADLASLQLGV